MPLSRFGLGPAGAALLLALLVAPAAVAQDVLGGAGKRGAATVWQGTCKYGVFGPRGVLQVGVPAPSVRGANTRRRTRRERTRVRYRVYVTDASANHATLTVSSWSAFIRVRQSSTRTWAGPTVFDMVCRATTGPTSGSSGGTRGG